MSKSLPLEAVKTMLKPVMHIVEKKADREDVPDVSGFIKSVNGATADENGNVDVTGLPEGTSAYQQLVTDGEGNTKWEDRTHYAEEKELLRVDFTDTYYGIPIQYAFYKVSDDPTFARPGNTVNGITVTTIESGNRNTVDIGGYFEGDKGLCFDNIYLVVAAFEDDFNLAELYGKGPVFPEKGLYFPVFEVNGEESKVVSATFNGVTYDWDGQTVGTTLKLIDPKYLPEEKRYALTETITLAEAINSKTLTFTEDADSYQLALSCPAAEAALGISVEVYTVDGLVAYMWMAGMIDTTAKYAKCSMYRAHGEWVFESMQPVNNENQTSAVSRNPKFVSAEKPITKIVVYASGGGMMPAGTTIEVRTF